MRPRKCFAVMQFRFRNERNTELPNCKSNYKHNPIDELCFSVIIYYLNIFADLFEFGTHSFTFNNVFAVWRSFLYQSHRLVHNKTHGLTAVEKLYPGDTVAVIIRRCNTNSNME